MSYALTGIKNSKQKGERGVSCLLVGGMVSLKRAGEEEQNKGLIKEWLLLIINT